MNRRMFCRLLLAAQVTKIRPNRLSEYDFQGYVGDAMVFSGSMIGVPIHRGAKREPS